jgi:hypothetical protein
MGVVAIIIACAVIGWLLALILWLSPDKNTK